MAHLCGKLVCFGLVVHLFLIVIESRKLACKFNERWKTNKKTECEPCPVCPVGQGLPTDCGFGYGTGLECTPCITGKTYRSDISKLKCVRCTDCSLYYREFKYQCRETIDAECGACLKDYYDAHRYERDRNTTMYPCYHCSAYPDDSDCVDYHERLMTTLEPESEVKIIKVVTKDNQTSLILGVLLALACCIILGLLIYLYKRTRRNQQNQYDRKDGGNLEGAISCHHSALESNMGEARHLTSREHAYEEVGSVNQPDETKDIRCHDVTLTVEPKDQTTNEALPPEMENTSARAEDEEIESSIREISLESQDSDTASVSGISDASTLFMRNRRHDIANFPPVGNSAQQPLLMPSEMDPNDEETMNVLPPQVQDLINENDTQINTQEAGIGIRVPNQTAETATIQITINNNVSSSPPNGTRPSLGDVGIGGICSETQCNIDLDSTTPKFVAGHMSCGRELMSAGYSIPVQESIPAKV